MIEKQTLARASLRMILVLRWRDTWECSPHLLFDLDLRKVIVTCDLWILFVIVSYEVEGRSRVIVRSNPVNHDKPALKPPRAPRGYKLA